MLHAEPALAFRREDFGSARRDPSIRRCGAAPARDEILNAQVDPCIHVGKLVAERDVACREGWNATDVDAGEKVVAADVADNPARTEMLAHELREVHSERVLRRRSVERGRLSRVSRLALDVVNLL